MNGVGVRGGSAASVSVAVPVVVFVQAVRLPGSSPGKYETAHDDRPVMSENWTFPARVTDDHPPRPHSLKLLS